MSQKTVDHKNVIFSAPTPIDFDKEKYNRERLESIARAVEEIALVNPECMLGHRNDLVEILPEDMIRWRLDVLLQIPEVELRTLLVFIKKREQAFEETLQKIFNMQNNIDTDQSVEGIKPVDG